MKKIVKYGLLNGAEMVYDHEFEYVAGSKTRGFTYVEYLRDWQSVIPIDRHVFKLGPPIRYTDHEDNRVSINRMAVKTNDIFIEWCQENIFHEYIVGVELPEQEILFSNIDDAALFSLRWS